MRLSLFVLWAFVGWCTTGVPVWWWQWRRWFEIVPPPDIPERPPRPNWLPHRIIGVVGGVVGGWLFTEVFGPQPEPWVTAGPRPEPWLPVVFAAATTVGAFLGTSLLTDLYEIVRGRGKATRG
jgi:hypothetical protein